jgi:hypothetical protein
MKDNHHYHKQQVKDGKWLAKETAAKKYAEQNKMNFHIVFPSNYVAFCKNLIRYSLNYERKP